MTIYDKGSRLRLALSRSIRKAKRAVESATGTNRVTAQYRYNYLMRTFERMENEFGQFSTDQIAFQRGTATILRDAQRAIKAPATQAGTKEGARMVEALIKQFTRS